ncbi:MAG: hypothetical protein A2W25_12060 [candidate division Zixibacteria bacterium RBG_16_53_22]|nr:MAG: hypothetical protein A2W25_12060 [candidate division Zixibacteria bacterium RBG_16_53_22]
MDSLVIPLQVLYENARRYGIGDLRFNQDTGEATIYGLGEGELVGKITYYLGKPDSIFVTSIECCGEGSGRCWSEVLMPTLEHSTGRLVAIQVWEGGDSITRLTVQDGVVKEEQIEL